MTDRTSVRWDSKEFWRGLSSVAELKGLVRLWQRNGPLRNLRDFYRDMIRYLRFCAQTVSSRADDQLGRRIGAKLKSKRNCNTDGTQSITPFNFKAIKCRQRPTSLKGFRLSAFGIFQRNNSIEHGQFRQWTLFVHFTLFCKVQLRIFKCFWLFSVRVLNNVPYWGGCIKETLSDGFYWSNEMCRNCIFALQLIRILCVAV